MIEARWNGIVIAASNDTVVVEGNHYFPRTEVDDRFLEASDHHSWCGWKGTADYFHVVADGVRSDNAAWFYPDPMDGAEEVRDRVAFWNGVEVGPAQGTDGA